MTGVVLFLAGGFVLFMVVVARAQLVHRCLDQISSGKQCCTPSSFIKLTFTLRLNSEEGGCDPPSYLDQGVRLEVRRPGFSWEPVRFYTATTGTSPSSLLTLIPGDTHDSVEDENNIIFPVYENHSREPFVVTEYFCGGEYYAPGTEYRWLQHYRGPAIPGEETWYIGNVSFTYSEHGVRCSAQLTEHAFRNAVGSELDRTSWIPPSCDHEQPLTVYVSGESEVEGSTQRGVLITPTWWNADCTWRTMAGCALSDGCSANDIGDNMCSIGSGLQCQCQHRHLTGDSNTCFDGIVGFERTVYDVSEHESAELCIVVLLGRLTEEVSLHVVAHSGTAIERADFQPLSKTVTLTPADPKQCVSVTTVDNSLEEETESLTVSISLADQFNSAVQLSQDTASFSIIDNDYVIISIPNTVKEGELLAIDVEIAPNSVIPSSQQRVTLLTASGSANGLDFAGRSLTVGFEQLSILGQIPINNDSFWEGYEHFSVSLSIQDRTYSKTIYIVDSNELRIGFTASDYVVNENYGSVMVCVALQGSVADGVEFHLTVSTQDQSAQEVLDYRGISDVATFSSNSMEYCITLGVVNDTAVENNEFLTVFLSLPGEVENVLFTQQSVTVQIIDNDDVQIGFEESVYTVSERDMSVSVCVEVKQGTLGIPVDISFSTRTLTAQDQDDFTLSPNTVTLTSTDSKECVVVHFDDDLVLEETESLTVYLSSIQQSVQLSPANVTVFITNDDNVQIGFKEAMYTVSERDMSLSVCVEVKEGILGIPISVSFSTLGLNAQDQDVFILSPNFVTLTSTDSSECVVVHFDDDSVLEETESLTLSISQSGQQGVQLSPDTAIVFITNDDDVQIGFEESTYTASESDMSVSICAELKEGTLGTPVSISFSTSVPNPQDQDDFTLSPNTVTLTSTDSKECVVVHFDDDLVLEETESLTVYLSSIQQSVQLSPANVTVFITNDDNVQIGFKESMYTVSERDMSLSVCVEVKEGILGIPISVSFSTLGLNAQDQDVFILSPNFMTLTSTDSSECVVVHFDDDSVLEETESLTLSISQSGQQGVQLSPDTAIVFITNDDDVQIGFEESTYTASESDMSVSICAELKEGTLGIPVSISFSTSVPNPQDQDDFTLFPDTVILTSTDSKECVVVHFDDDTVYEETESLTVSLSQSGQQGIQLSPDTATIFITNDDDVQIGFVESTYTVSERDSTVSVCVEVKEGTLGIPIIVSVSTPSLSAQDQGGFILAPNTVTLTSIDSDECVVVHFDDDTVYEETESLTVSLSQSGQQGVQLSPDTATIFITNDDDVQIGFEESIYSVSERDMSVSVCAEVKEGTLGIPVSMSFSTTSHNARDQDDFTLFPDTVILTSTDSKECVVVHFDDDTVYEETESLTVSLSQSGQQGIQLSPDTATIFITNDDDVQIGFVESTYTVSERDLTVSVCVEVKEGTLGIPIIVSVSTPSLSDQVTVTSTDSNECVVVHFDDDTVYEETESLTVSLSQSGQQGVQLSPDTATIFITNDDDVHIGFEESIYSVSERDMSVSVCAEVKQGNLGIPVNISFTTHGQNAQENTDYLRLSADVTLSPDIPKQCVNVGIVDDAAVELNEMLTVTLSLTEQLSHVVFSEPNATLIIINDDSVEVGFERNSYAVNEIVSSVAICVVVVGNGSLGTDLELELETQDGTAQENEDYVRLSETVTLSPSVSKQCVFVTIISDSAVELNENLTVTISLIEQLSSVEVSPFSTAVVILDDDIPKLTTMVTEEKNETVRVVEVCIVTNDTLERKVILSVLINVTDPGLQSDTHTLELQPGKTVDCVTVNVSMEGTVVFLVMSDDGDVINPNGTIAGEPSFEALKKLLSGDNVNIQEAVEELQRLVNELVDSGLTASLEFSNTFMGVVSDVLDVSNNQSTQQTQGDIKEESGNASEPGTTLLITLDKFALRSFNASLGSVNATNSKLQILVFGKEDDVNVASDGESVTGIVGPNGDTIDIPAEILRGFNSTVTIASYYLHNVTGILPSALPNVSDAELVSSVVSSALGCGDQPCDPVINHSVDIRIEFHHRKVLSEETRCVFYDLHINEWSEEGCTANGTESTDELTVCYCNHLTHFAVMLSPKDSVDKTNAFSLQIIGYVGIPISLVCLLMTISIFCLFRSLWSMRNYIHINLCINLFISQLIFVAGINKTTYPTICQSIAVVLHYSFLVTFMWMLMEGVVLYVALVKVFVTKPRRYIISFTVISYGAPLLYMAVVVPLGFLLNGPHYGGDICWLKSDSHFIWAFAAPVILIILANVAFFTMAIYIIWKQQRRKNFSTNQIQKAKHWLKVSISLLVVMGITWIIGVLTFHEALLFVSYIFTIFVAFQGALIFILFVVLSKQVRFTMKKWLVRNIISKSDYLSDHFSEFTRSTQAGYSVSHSRSSSHAEKSTITRGIQLGTFLALPAKSTINAEMEKHMPQTETVSPSPPPTMSPSPSHNSPSRHPSSPQLPLDECKKDIESDDEHTKYDEDHSNPVFVTSDKDSGRGSPDTDTVSTPPSNSSQQPTLHT